MSGKVVALRVTAFSTVIFGTDKFQTRDIEAKHFYFYFSDTDVASAKAGGRGRVDVLSHRSTLGRGGPT